MPIETFWEMKLILKVTFKEKGTSVYDMREKCDVLRLWKTAVKVKKNKDGK